MVSNRSPDRTNRTIVIEAKHHPDPVGRESHVVVDNADDFAPGLLHADVSRARSAERNRKLGDHEMEPTSECRFDLVCRSAG